VVAVEQILQETEVQVALEVVEDKLAQEVLQPLDKVMLVVLDFNQYQIILVVVEEELELSVGLELLLLLVLAVMVQHLQFLEHLLLTLEVVEVALLLD
jgi:hypothetical protein